MRIKLRICHQANKSTMKPSQERRQQKREQKRKEAFENGLCTTCYARDPYPAHKSCGHCLLQGRQSREKHRTRRLRATHADSHRLMCSTCLVREPMLGRKQCNHCQEYYRNRLRRRRAANTASKSPMCSNCFTRDPAPGRKYCEHCRKISIMAHSRGMRATHVTSKSAMCSRCCSRCPAPGRKLCKRCAEMYHSHWERRKAANSEVESPKCTSCFIRYPISGRKRCATCRQAINGQGRAYRQKRRAENPEGCRTCFIRIRSPGFASCAQCREKGYAQKGDRDKRSIGMQTQSKAIRILLSPNTAYPLTSAIQMVMNAWYNNPHATMIVDIEYSSSAFSIFGPDAVFQIAIADARGDWIVPLTTINHRLPKRTLFERAHLLGWTEDRFKYEKAAIKFYGVANDNETEGLTWEEVGRLLKRHTEVYSGPSFQDISLTDSRSMEHLKLSSNGAEVTETIAAFMLDWRRLDRPICYHAHQFGKNGHLRGGLP
jgi:hypothetical protein